MMATQDQLLELYVENNTLYLGHVLASRKGHLLFAASSKLRRLRDACDKTRTLEEKNEALAELLDAIENHPGFKAYALLQCLREDIRVLRQQWGQRTRYDCSDPRAKDYYSVVVIVKDEARFIREFVLFYRATGADRIYLYDNDSTDNLLDELKPFIDAGYVVYQHWPGSTVQTAAYRDAIRRTKHKTTWLAFIDIDEFLFSPKGPMPEQLRAYEQYPAVGANWIGFGPNGHTSRPEGLVMDNYTTTFANYDEGYNHHVKSIVQPAQVFYIAHTHFAFYRNGRFAVSEDGQAMNNYPSFAPRAGRAFTRQVHRSTFRINHYVTKSLEDLEAKSRRGWPDGTLGRTFENELRAFECDLVQDHAIQPYADIVRQQYGGG